MAASNLNTIWFIIKRMTFYVSRLYKREKFGDLSGDVEIGDRYLPSGLKFVLSDAFDYFKNKRYVEAHNHCVKWEDRETHLTESFRLGLLEIATDQPHSVFLRECTLYIISATEMEKLDFPEAINIVMNAIYYACMNSKQHENLIQWKTENLVIENLNDDTAKHNNKSQNNIDDQFNKKARYDDGNKVQHIENARLINDVLHSENPWLIDYIQRKKNIRLIDVQQIKNALFIDVVQHKENARLIDDVQHIKDSRLIDNDQHNENVRHIDEVQHKSKICYGDHVKHKDDAQCSSEMDVLSDYGSDYFIDVVN